MSKTAPCTHPLLERHANEEHRIYMWACVDCHRRFYPACEQCVDVGHREGIGEHPHDASPS